jgi:hypothetical protein
VWKTRRRTEFWRFNSEPKFDYWNAYKYRPESQGDICDVMCSLGACFFMSRERFWQLDGLDESHGSWGNFGIEIAAKSWLSGGRHVVNKRTWFSHFFRVGGHGFPYPITGAEQQRARDYSRDLWFNNRWGKQVLPFSWLVEKFWPVPGWEDSDLASLRALGASFRADPVPVGPVVGPKSAALAQDAAALHAPGQLAQPGFGHGMAINAVSAPAVMGPDAAAQVLCEANELQVGRIAASSVPAQVIQLGDVAAESDGNGRNEPCVHEAVGQITLAPESEAAVSGVTAGGPFPTSVGCYADLVKDSPDSVCIEVGDREIFGRSHGAASSAVSGLGSVACGQHVSGPSILPNIPQKCGVCYSGVTPLSMNSATSN